MSIIILYKIEHVYKIGKWVFMVDIYFEAWLR